MYNSSFLIDFKSVTHTVEEHPRQLTAYEWYLEVCVTGCRMSIFRIIHIRIIHIGNRRCIHCFRICREQMCSARADILPYSVGGGDVCAPFEHIIKRTKGSAYQRRTHELSAQGRLPVNAMQIIAY